MTWLWLALGCWLAAGAVVALWIAPVLRDHHDLPDLGE